MVVEDVLEVVVPTVVEGVAPLAVRQREAGGHADVLRADLVVPAPGRVGDRRARRDQVAAHAVDVEGRADGGDPLDGLVPETDVGQAVLRRRDPVGEGGLAVGIRADEAHGRVLVGHAAPHDLDADAGVARGGDVDGQPEAVEQLGTQLALLGVHGADEDESRCVRDGHALALDAGAPHRGRVQEGVDEVVRQEVDLVDVEHAAVRLRQQTGVEGDLAAREEAVEVQRPDHPVLGRADGQLDQADGPRDRAVAVQRDVRAPGVGSGGVAREPVARNDLHGGQHRGEGAHHRGLGGALLAADEDATDGGRDGGQAEGQAHVVHPDDGAEREGLGVDGRHRAAPAASSRSPSASR